MAPSDVWNFFTKCVDDLSKAKSTLCDKKISRGEANSRDFTTSNLRLHLDKEHHATYSQFKRKHNDNTPESNHKKTNNSSSHNNVDVSDVSTK